MDRPDKFDDPPASPENRLAAAEIRARHIRTVLGSWNARARALGYDGVADLLGALESKRSPVNGSSATASTS